MNLGQELRDLRRHFLLWFFLFIVGVIVIGLCRVSFTFVHGIPVPFFDNTGSSIAAHFFIIIKQNLLPPGVELISTSPITVFLVQMKVAFLISFVFLFPYLLYCSVRYFSPALFANEKAKLSFISFLSTVLFASGMFFAYHFLVLSMFRLLLSFNKDLQVVSFLSIDEFVSWTLASLIITGVLFLVPVFMYILSVFHITKSSFWIVRWREAFVVFLVLASIITPDVSGVSIVLLSIPMAILYYLGIILSAAHERKRERLLRQIKAI